jgi:hypothetical protein
MNAHANGEWYIFYDCQLQTWQHCETLSFYNTDLRYLEFVLPIIMHRNG